MQPSFSPLEKLVACPSSWTMDPNSSVLDGPSYSLNLTHDKRSEAQIAGAKYRHLGIWKKKKEKKRRRELDVC